MAMQMSIRKTNTFCGKAFSSSKNFSAPDGLIKEVSVGPAKAGVLTTRTDNNTGTLTLDSGHGITTGQRIDLYWEGGVQRAITVGTVSGTSVPIDLGVGDNLPIATTAVLACVCVEEVFVFDGDNLVGLLMYAQARGLLTLTQDDDTIEMVQELQDASVYEWDEDCGIANPVVGDDIGKVFFSTESTTAITMRIGALLNN